MTLILSPVIDNYSTWKSTKKGWIQSESVPTTSEWTGGKSQWSDCGQTDYQWKILSMLSFLKKKFVCN